MKRSPSPLTTPAATAGFTLVEMLVATGLVALIMVLFAQIYGSAMGTMTDQRAMANNDQKARIVTSVIRNDLRNATYRQATLPYGETPGIVPLVPGDEGIIDPVNQRGYFYIAENDSQEQTDDVLQFTAMIRTPGRGGPSTLYTGRAGRLNLNAGSNNEPEWDDGIPDNGLGQSRAAEIAYFLRHGVLYRRVLLLRDPLPIGGTLNDQPTHGDGLQRFRSDGTMNYPAGANYYEDFDFSAARKADSAGNYLWFHSLNSLDNRQGTNNLPLAYPTNRFGFNPVTGAPVEHDSNGRQPQYFFGRFTSQETSDSRFLYPGQNPPNANHPYLRNDLQLGSNGVIQQYDSNVASRIGEDILLTNVDAFDIDVIDESVGGSTGQARGIDIYDLGATMGDFAQANFTDPNRLTFDTWHPSIPVSQSPPWRRLRTQSGFTDMTVQAFNRTLSPGNNQYIVPAGLPSSSPSLVYVCIDSGTGVIAEKPPEYPPIPGTVVQDGDSYWRCIDNRISLKGIQILIRYRDIQNDTPRYVTIFHSFVE